VIHILFHSPDLIIKTQKLRTPLNSNNNNNNKSKLLDDAQISIRFNVIKMNDSMVPR
jgi:hypothetical protein